MRRASFGLITAMTFALVIAFVAMALSIVAVTRARSGTITLNQSNMPDKRTVSVSGTGVVTLTPDIARFSVGVQEQGKNLTEVQGVVATGTDNVIKALVGKGIDDKKDIKTSNYSIAPIYDYPKDKAPVVSGYRVSNTVNVTVRGLDQDPKKVGPIFDAVVAVGATNIGNITFDLSDPDKANRTARDEAMKNAAGKAQALAAAGGALLGPVLTVSDQSVTPGPARDVQAAPAPAAAGGAAPPTQIVSGETSVTVTVNVTYALQ